jgi:F-type H+-transporting ATPase subunit b
MHPDVWTIALQTLNFAILVWLLHRFLYKPVLAAIDARKAAIRRELDAAKEASKKATARLAELDAKRAGIAAEREAALRAAAAEARAMAEAARARAEQDAAALAEATRRTLADERDAALAEARTLALDLGISFAQRLLADIPERLRAEAWIERIEAHLAALPETERAALGRQLGDGATLRVATASVLAPQAAATWRDRLRQALGTTAEIRFAADPVLVAGADLTFPGAILRFSWRHAVETARAELASHDEHR